MTIIQPIVVLATPITSSSVGLSGANPSAPWTNVKYTVTRNEITMPASSLQAFTRHQNQRSRKMRPVPAPIWSRIWNACDECSSHSDTADASAMRITVTTRPTFT